MKYEFFKNVKTIEELKEQYKKLAFKHHPDKGGKLEDMQKINIEYDELFKIVKDTYKTADGKTYSKQSNYDEMPDTFKKIINAIINFNCKIELCGNWLWVFNGYQYKKELKELNFFYCSKKRAWAWTDTPTKKNKHKLTLDEIRRLHGSEIIKEQEEQEKQKQIQKAG